MLCRAMKGAYPSIFRRKQGTAHKFIPDINICIYRDVQRFRLIFMPWSMLSNQLIRALVLIFGLWEEDGVPGERTHAETGTYNLHTERP